jgi:uncharacterized protein (DUF488 family)
MTMQDTVFTVGHSTHTQQRFIGLLLQHGIAALCDVRSKPYSRMNPQFNREELMQSLQAHGITYVFLGKELGARSQDPACYENGKVQFERLAHTELFREGLARLRKGMKEYQIALMCAEKEPLECHRTILVARHVTASGLNVQHIHSDGELESHTAAVNRLKQLLRLPESDMFRSSEEVLAEAYHLQEERIAYQTKSAAVAASVSSRSATG